MHSFVNFCKKQIKKTTVMGSRTHLDKKQVSLKKHEKYFYTGNPYTGMQVKNVTNSWHIYLYVHVHV